jgi:hypothetical protein
VVFFIFVAVGTYVVFLFYTEDMNFLEMTPYDFDQTDAGWRSLDKEGRYLEAAGTIEQFIGKRRSDITTNPSIQTLHFHAGQEYATAGPKYYEEALHCFSSAYKDRPEWDAYVAGTRAFLYKDQRALDNAVEELASLNDDNVMILIRFASALRKGDYSYRRNYERGS